MADKKNISSTKSLIENDKLKEYLKDNLSEELLHSIDKAGEDDEFFKDAMEGLASFSSTQKIHANAQQLHQKLQQTTHKKRKTRPFEFSQIMWYVIAVIVIILLVLLGFEVLRLRN